MGPHGGAAPRRRGSGPFGKESLGRETMKKKLRSDFNSRQYMLSRDFELFYYSDEHFSSVGRHSHPYTEVYLFCEGAVDMEIEGRRHALRPGDVLVLPPETVHRAVVRSGETPYRRFVFWLSEDFCAALRTEAGEYLYLFDRARERREYVYPMDRMEFNSLRGKLFAITEELHTDRFGRDAQIALGVRELLRRRSQPGRAEPGAVFEQILYRAPRPGEHRAVAASVYHEKAPRRLHGRHARRREHRRELRAAGLCELRLVLPGVFEGIRPLPLGLSEGKGLSERGRARRAADSGGGLSACFLPRGRV